MKRVCLFLAMSLISSHAWAQDKSAYDVDVGPGLGKVDARPLSVGSGSAILRNPITELTLISGGYFTIGTSGGLAGNTLDDHCGISFGHPYALTSYPTLSWDGTWQKPDEFFADAVDVAPERSGDSLKLALQQTGLVSLSFALVQGDGGKTIELVLRVKNLDSAPHRVGVGLVFDPALGRWGDGHVILAQFGVERDTLLSTPNLPSELELWERAASARGMGARLDFSASPPDQFRLANWVEIYKNPAPIASQDRHDLLYDLTLNASWEPIEIAPNGERSYRIALTLLPPDFGSAAFMRWDLPAFLSIENNLLFPRALTATVQIANVGAAPIVDASLDVNAPAELTLSTSPALFSVGAGEIAYKSLELRSRELYEDQITTLRAQCLNNGQPVDELVRHVFIPAIPLSDTGLVVTIDTVDVASLPKVNLVFESRIAATQQLLTRLASENVFLHENDSRIRDFTMAKDTTGGAGAADIVFVLDVTGSMSDEIDDVKNNVIEFADSLSRRGIDFRLGMVTFLDFIENVYAFTTDVQAFQQLVGQQFAHGGDDEPENSLEALQRAAQFPFRPTAKRIAVWITDASYHESDSFTSLTKQQVIDLLLANDLTVHTIGNPYWQTSFYDPIVISTGGNYYSIYGNFRDILIDISRFRVSGRYRMQYTSPASPGAARQIRVEVHYAGLGGSATTTISPAGQAAVRSLLTCYPNPFNPATRICVDNPGRLAGEIAIFNVLGQRVRRLALPHGQGRTELSWDGRDDRGFLLSTGLYIVQLSLFDKQGRASMQQVQKVLYMK